MKQSILVVDDDELVRETLAHDLMREGFAVSTAPSGESALAFLQRNPADLVLCDLVLGDIDGIEVLRRIKANWPETAVVMITGHASIRNALDALRAGAADYIAKPADPEEVAHRLRTVLDAERLRRSLSAERARAEARRRETQDLLIRTERMSSLATLASGAADELNSILQPARHYAQSLRDLLHVGHAGAPYAQAIVESIDRAQSLLHDLKAIGTGMSYEKAQVHLVDAIRKALESAEVKNLSKTLPKVRLETRLDLSAVTVRGSEKALANCIAHLVAHAMERASPAGVVQIDLLVERLEHAVGRYGSGPAGEYAVVRIRDTGPPLTAEDLEKLVEPFYVPASRPRRFVSGISLALVHRIVSDHGGFLDARATEPIGNEYMLYLPLSAADDSSELKPDYTGTENILLVDDHEEHRRAAGDILRNLGYQVVSAANGREALSIFEAGLRGECAPFDLVVLDLVLGDDLDGVEIFKKMNALKPGQPAVLVSGFADIARIVEARRMGIRQSVQKPYTTESLGAAVRAALNGR